MPVSVVCESTASVNAALRESLGTANVCTVTSAAIGDDVKAAIASANGCAATNTTDDCDSLQNKLVASTKRVLLTKIEYEEVANYGQTVLDNLKSKYIILKPSGHNGEINHNSPAIGNNNNHNNSNSNNGAADINGNSTIIPAGAKLRTNPNELPQPKRILYPREHVRIGWKTVGRKWEVGVGMVNVGNTCYLNSTLQALFHVPSLANWLMSDSAHMERCDSADTGCIICAMAKTLQASQNSQSSIRPYFVYSKLKSICKHLVMGRQEDAHEFLRYLVEAMEKSYLSRFRNFKELDQFSKETTPLNQILGGYLKSAVRCLSCNHVSVTFQHFQDLLLDIRKADTIEEALEGYFSRERLEDMGYKCEACKKKVSATKQFSLERAPIALCIQLKRFSMLGTKLNKQITIKPKLDLTKYASRRMAGPGEHHLTYRLVAMVTHLGASQHCGHYTAIGLTESGTYYNYDDSYVRPISVQNVCNTNAYIIFYEMDTQPTTITTQQSSCTQVCGAGGGSDVSQAVKMNGHVMNASSPQRMIGPQLPPSGLRNYSATNGSNITPPTTTPTTTTITSTSLLTNGNKLGLNRCSPSSTSSLTSAASNNNKIMIHFKNNNLTNATATTTTLKTSTANCSSMVTTAATSSSVITNNNSNSNSNNSNPALYNNYTSNPRGEAASRMVGKKHTTTNANKSSFYSSSDGENGRINSTTTITALTLTPSKTATQSTLPSMPKLSSDSNLNATITTSTRTGVSSSQKQKIATIIKPQHLENKKSSAPPLLKSLVPYGGSETEEENEAIVTITALLEQPIEQCQLPQKRLQTTNCLKRRQSNGGNSVQSRAQDSGSNSDQDDTNNDCKMYNNERSINKSQKMTQNGSASVMTKRKPADSIDEIFDNVKRSCSSNNIMTQPNNTVTSTTPAADTSSSSSDEEGALNGSCRVPFNRAQSTPPSPPVIKTKTGLWQVTALSQPIINSKSNKINTPHSVNGKSNNNYVMEKPMKNPRNPFATNNTTRLTTTQLPSLTTSALSMESLNTNGKRFKKDSFTTTANNKTFNGTGYQRETASDSAINELLKQSHRGYGAPVLTWNGQQTEIEREVKAETREQRQRDWQHEEENEMDRGRQKKVKTLRGSHTNNRPPGYNPFQEQQENQNSWKRYHPRNNHHHHHHTRHYHYPNSAVVGHLRHSFQRNKFKFQRFPHKFSSRRSSNNSNNNTSGGSGSLNYRRDS